MYGSCIIARMRVKGLSGSLIYFLKHVSVHSKARLVNINDHHSGLELICNYNNKGDIQATPAELLSLCVIV